MKSIESKTQLTGEERRRLRGQTKIELRDCRGRRMLDQIDDPWLKDAYLVLHNVLIAADARKIGDIDSVVERLAEAETVLAKLQQMTS